MAVSGSPNGYPAQIIEIDHENSYHLNVEALEDVLLQPSVRDKNICVVSVAGGFRKGKSFLLDFFIKYLSAPDKDLWLSDEDSPLSGFPWRGGSDRHTTGILLWSKPFHLKLDDGTEVVVLLMDTQGSFDTQSTVKQCATVFALSTMLSSVQVYNIHGNIQEDDLQHLQLFTEYARVAMSESDDHKPFQTLQFLVRDWAFSYEHDFGFEGGMDLLNKRLEVNDKMHVENTNLRHQIKTSFDRLQCFLMPHPGMEVASDPKFDGRLKDIHPNFVKKIGEFVPQLLSTKNLQVKKIYNTPLTGKTWLQYLKAYMKIYESDQIPEVKTLLNATAEANNLSALIQCTEVYTKQMNAICGPERPFMNPNDVKLSHKKYKAEALALFKSTKKMGSTAYCLEFEEKLNKNIDNLEEDFQKTNAQKNIFKNLKTPMVLFMILLISYLVAGMIDILGIETITKLFLFPFYIALISLITWGVLTYLGNYPQILSTIDDLTMMFLEKIVMPVVFQASVQPLTQRH